MNFLPGASARGPGSDLGAGELRGVLRVKASLPQLQREGTGPGWVPPQALDSGRGEGWPRRSQSAPGRASGVLSRRAPRSGDPATTCWHQWLLAASLAMYLSLRAAILRPNLPGPCPCPQHPRLPTGSMALGKVPTSQGLRLLGGRMGTITICLRAPQLPLLRPHHH